MHLRLYPLILVTLLSLWKCVRFINHENPLPFEYCHEFAFVWFSNFFLCWNMILFTRWFLHVSITWLYMVKGMRCRFVLSFPPSLLTIDFIQFWNFLLNFKESDHICQWWKWPFGIMCGLFYEYHSSGGEAICQ